MTADRTVVLLAYYYPPLGGIGAQRALSLARHLPALGFRVVVVTPRHGAHPPDASLGTGTLPGVTVVRTASFEPALLARRLPAARGSSAGGDLVEERPTRGAARLIRRVLHSALYFPDHARGWAPFAAAAARRAIRDHAAAAVVSTSPPISGHLAALSAARAAGVPAVLDFRDLWTAHRPAGDRSRRAERERRLERRLLAAASAVVSATDGVSAWLRQCAGEASAGRPFAVIRNGYEESDFTAPPPPREEGVFRIVHAGTVYGARQDTTAFFRAVARLRATGAFGPRRLEIVLAGKVAAQTLAAAQEAGCTDSVRATGFLRHDETLRHVRAATVNLLLVWSEPGPVAGTVCPGKLYELLAAGRPILALSLPGGEAARLLRETGGALLADPRDEGGIADALGRLAAAEGRGDALLAVPPRVADLSRFTRRAAAAAFAGLLSALAR